MPSRRELGGERGALGGGGVGESASRSRRSAVSIRSVRPVSGSMSVSSPTSTSVLLAGIDDLDGEHGVSAATLDQRRRASRAARGSPR